MLTRSGFLLITNLQKLNTFEPHIRLCFDHMNVTEAIPNANETLHVGVSAQYLPSRPGNFITIPMLSIVNMRAGCQINE